MNQERYNVLAKCLTLLEALRRSYSRNEASQVAKDGYERPFEELTQECCVLREMLREIRYGN